MGKLPYMYTDSEDTDTASSVENDKKKKKFSILKYSTANVKKKKCKVHSVSRSDPEDSEFSSRSSHRVKHKLHGILKHRESSDDEEEPEPVPRSQDRCLVGRVPRPPGARPGRGGGVALLVRKNTALKGFQSLQAQNSTSDKKSRSLMKRLVRKGSY